MIQKTVNDWIKNPKGRYQEGVAIFKACASDNIRKKYLAYFEQVKGEPGQFDQHMTMLVNKVCAIRDKIRLFPDKFSSIDLTLIKRTDNEEELRQKNLEIEDLKTRIESLEEELTDLEADSEADKETIDSKESEIEMLENRLEELVSEYESLKERRGVQIVHHDDLPDDIQKLYNRVKEITPLMASLHAEISNKKKSTGKRKKLVDELVKLDDERRAAWDAIDSWAEGKEVSLPNEDRETSYSNDAIVRGAQMARRIERLKENIANSQRVADETKREIIRENALKRIAAYQSELDELTEALEVLPKTDEPQKEVSVDE